MMCFKRLRLEITGFELLGRFNLALVKGYVAVNQAKDIEKRDAQVVVGVGSFNSADSICPCPLQTVPIHHHQP
jgi:hypothetical protein